MKPTKSMSNSQQMLRQLSKRCDHSHEHQPLVGGRCADAAFYPLPLIRAILNGIEDTTKALQHARMEAVENGVHAAAVICANRAQKPAEVEEDGVEILGRTVMQTTGGGQQEVVFTKDNFKAQYYDEYTGEPLPNDLVRAAMIEEMSYFSEKTVWTAAKWSDMKGSEDSSLVRMRWVLCNKGDAKEPDVRARLVACEVAKDKQSAFYASTPPLEAKKKLFSRYSAERVRHGKPLAMGFVDIKKAYFNGIPQRNIFMAPPKELGIGKTITQQTRCVYGTRDAGMIWEETYRSCLEELGFQSGRASPCCFWHPEWEVSLVVHDDDFTSLGLDDGLDKLEEGLKTKFEIKVRGRMGEHHECKQMRILNRVVTLSESGLTYEADPRHAELLIRNMAVSNSVGTPGVKDSDLTHAAPKEQEGITQPAMEGQEHVAMEGQRQIAAVNLDNGDDDTLDSGYDDGGVCYSFTSIHSATLPQDKFDTSSSATRPTHDTTHLRQLNDCIHKPFGRNLWPRAYCAVDQGMFYNV